MTFADIVNNVIVPFVDRGVIPLLYVLAFIFFLIGVTRLFFTDNEEKRKQGKMFALWGLIGIVVIFSIWGILRVFLSILSTGVI